MEGLDVADLRGDLRGLVADVGIGMDLMIVRMNNCFFLFSIPAAMVLVVRLCDIHIRYSFPIPMKR